MQLLLVARKRVFDMSLPQWEKAFCLLCAPYNPSVAYGDMLLEERSAFFVKKPI